jgi:hypothetical protein
MNARFWQWIAGGWVRITLRPGQTLTRHTGGPTEEGWESETESWEHRGDHVAYGWERNGQDCDGLFDHGGKIACPLDRLTAGEGHDGTPIPAWERADRWQRDHAAELAGY